MDSIRVSIDPAEPASPLFIVGSPRSGTSVLTDAAFAAGYTGYREGNLLGLLHPLRERVDAHFRQFRTENPKVMMSRLEPKSIHDPILDLFKQILESLNPKTPWVDKTCNWPMLKVLPQLVTLWPGSRIIFARRRGIENVRSRLKKFPGRDFMYHCQDWATTMATWREVRQQIEPGRYLETDQRDLLLSPGAIATQISALLSLNQRAQARVEHALTNLRSQETEPGTAAHVGSLDDGEWTAAQVEEFIRVCGVEMDQYGYAVDASYRTAAIDL